MAERRRLGLLQAMRNGALIGALMLLINLYFQGELARVGIAGGALMLLGGAAGGAVLFLVIALLVNVIRIK